VNGLKQETVSDVNMLFLTKQVLKVI